MRWCVRSSERVVRAVVQACSRGGLEERVIVLEGDERMSTEESRREHSLNASLSAIILEESFSFLSLSR